MKKLIGIIIAGSMVALTGCKEERKPLVYPAYGIDKSGKTVKSYSELMQKKKEILQYWSENGTGIHEREVSSGKGGLIYKKGYSSPFSGIVHKTYGNGKTKACYTLVDGKMDGVFIRYLPDGEVELTGNYKTGKLNGLMISYSNKFIEWLEDDRVVKHTKYDEDWQKEKIPDDNNDQIFIKLKR